MSLKKLLNCVSYEEIENASFKLLVFENVITSAYQEHVPINLVLQLRFILLLFNF
jgi:hypothetical protein